MEKLAIFGGTPVRETPIHYGRQYIDEADCAAVREVLLGDYLTTGPKPGELEARLCKITGAAHGVCISNGTAALHAACYAAGIGPGDEVITTPITFAASANSVLYCGGTPVFADIDPATWNLCPEAAEEKITPRTKAIIAVDFGGQPADLEKLGDLCRKHNLILIEDAAHSLGSSLNGKMVGSIADLTTLSFHPVKTVTGGEGGAVLTNRPDFYERLALFRTHGITRNPEQMTREPEGPWYYEQIELGYNYRLTDFQAALILSQLDKLELFATRRKEIVQRYNEAFAGMPQLTVQQEIPGADSVRHFYVLRLNLQTLSGTRREIFDALTGEGVLCNVHYIPVYTLPYYQNLGYLKGLCPQAEAFYEGAITIPLYYSMTDADVESVIEAVKKVLLFFTKKEK
ncbi:UDP-4-amino-4,6-dideoxy-N-acetyl-beta-L-altrosamine transaminase [Oscillospiraceae bacterium MB08-C2-2]|nr:UDP-4-amino-4,6-dideoxy-N-acetyl-beta-L-altrosamine transaminase [Oscillospiraceae bacterium MB08-C2-2]